MSFAYAFYTESYTSIDHVITQMQQLDRELEHTNLRNLIAFNHTYLLITLAVKEKFGQNFFDDDVRMEQFDILFAKYYFDALHNYINNRPCAPAWKILFDNCKQGRLMQWQFMALGVNAHVNNDLPQTLRESDLGPSYLVDYNKINTILYGQLPNIVYSLVEQNRALNFFENSLVTLYRPFLWFIIGEWRKVAWQNYLRLQQKPHEKEQIEKWAVGIAYRFGAR